MTIDADLKAFATGKNFAALTTLLPGGQPQTHLMWVAADLGVDEQVLVVGRQKFRNVEADPRVTVTVFDAANPYRYVEARGQVVSTVTGEAARADIDDLSQKYTGGPYANPIGTERVVLQIAVDKVHKNGV